MINVEYQSSGLTQYANDRVSSFVHRERLTPQQFDRFREFIYRKSGIRIDDRKVTLLTNRVRRRLSAGGFDDFDVYYKFLTSPSGTDELSGFLDAVTTNETFFFRTPKQFEWFTGQWITEQVGSYRDGRREPSLKIWSAGCANGAEPYSIAICLAENAYRLGDWSLEVVGTDISNAMLTDAREGIFKSRAIEAVTERQRRRFFRAAGDDRWQVRKQIKQMVQFRDHNLMRPMQDGPFDCIFIRNVLIYFDLQSKTTVLKNLVDALAVDGYLVLGPSEGVYELLGELRRVSPLVYQKVNKHPRPTPGSDDKGRQP